METAYYAPIYASVTVVTVSIWGLLCCNPPINLRLRSEPFPLRFKKPLEREKEAQLPP